MFETTVMPRFAETDGLGHINNAVLGVWFEDARMGVFRIFNPTLTLETWNLILRKADYEFLAQIHIGHEVRIETTVAHVGTTSMSCLHRAFQGDVLVASGTSVMIHFNYQTQKKQPIPDGIRAELLKHATPEG